MAEPLVTLDFDELKALLGPVMDRCMQVEVFVVCV
jgi:hypothetical protein